MVHDHGFMRVETMDELEPDQKLIDREDAKVRKAIPDDYLWDIFKRQRKTLASPPPPSADATRPPMGTLQ